MNSTEKRRALLTEAENCVCSERVDQYGQPEDNFKVIADLWSIYLGFETGAIHPHDVGIMMALMKIGRIHSGQKKDDNYIDAIGYMACAGGLAPEEQGMLDAGGLAPEEQGMLDWGNVPAGTEIWVRNPPSKD